MATDLKRYTDFLESIGTRDVEHSGEGFFAHLLAVYRDLKSWGADEDVCLAGMFHSIYGTELFQNFSLPVERRGDVHQLIGERAERLAYLNCAMDRPTFDALVKRGGTVPLEMGDRLTGETIQLTQQEFEDLRTIHVCDWLEQVGRTKHWDYRRDAYREMAEQHGGVAVEEYDRVFAAAPAAEK